jgi:hypothetical protein
MSDKQMHQSVRAEWEKVMTAQSKTSREEVGAETTSQFSDVQFGDDESLVRFRPH